jgi:thymidylate synthase
MAWKPVLGELRAFLAGATMNRDFIHEGCTYWTQNAKAWGRNDARDNDDLFLGKIYGAQWRNFNGVDQIEEVRRQLKEDKSSRRILLTCWNPAELHLMCLPPCHIMAQFHVDGNELRCSIYMRSVDLALGLPSDIVLYYALLLHFARDVDLIPMGLFFHFGNAHLYTTHTEQMRMHYKRVPIEMPTFHYQRHDGTGFPPGEVHVDIETYKPMEAIRYELLV